jgi:hypothetical protein
MTMAKLRFSNPIQPTKSRTRTIPKRFEGCSHFEWQFTQWDFTFQLSCSNGFFTLMVTEHPDDFLDWQQVKQWEICK